VSPAGKTRHTPGIDRPPAPVAIRAAVLLMLMVIAYRVLLVFGSLEAVAGGRLLRPPGSLGSPLLLFVLIPLVLVARHLVRRGHGLARHLYAAYAGLRLLAIVLSGDLRGHGLVLFLLYAASALSLYTPAANRWFAEARTLRRTTR
jgi:hypothetical protein